jgi:hypothetical protein
MKRKLVILMVVSMLLSSMVGVSAMSQGELNIIKQDMQNQLDQAEEVSWSELQQNPDAYKGHLIKFSGYCVGIGESAKNIALKDDDGKLWVVAQGLPYRFKLNTMYTMAATFYDFVTASDGDVAVVFSTEAGHLPVMDEWFN